MSAIAAAFGSIIGYVGAEVAEESVFDRLLWPQRFFNHLEPASAAKLALFMSMAGPLHGAALAVLDRLRDHGLYLGRLRGDMLGTAFYHNMEHARYYHRTALGGEKKRNEAKEVRNGFWINVLKSVNEMICHESLSQPKHQGESQSDDDIEAGRRKRLESSALNMTDGSKTSQTSSREGQEKPSRTVPHQQTRDVRSIRSFFKLHLEFTPNKGPDGVFISEANLTGCTILGVLISEFSSIVVACATAIWHHLRVSKDKEVPPLWLVAFFCIPLLLRLLALPLSVCRNGIEKPKREPFDENEHAMHPSYEEMFEVDSPSIGKILITTSGCFPSTVQQFSRHYGHPKRDGQFDRYRELACIVIIYAFVLYFPAGLLLLAWMNEPTQYLWLGHQLYCVITMHFVRIFGWQGSGRTEERVAAALMKRMVVYFGEPGAFIKATLVVNSVNSVEEGRKMLKEKLEENRKLLQRTGTHSADVKAQDGKTAPC